MSEKTSCFPLGAGISTFTEKVAERSTGQFPRASLHDQLFQYTVGMIKIMSTFIDCFFGHNTTRQAKVYRFAPSKNSMTALLNSSGFSNGTMCPAAMT